MTSVYRYMVSVYRYMVIFYRYMVSIYYYMTSVYRYMVSVSRYMAIFYRYMVSVYRYMVIFYRYMVSVCRYMAIHLSLHDGRGPHEIPHKTLGACSKVSRMAAIEADRQGPGGRRMMWPWRSSIPQAPSGGRRKGVASMIVWSTMLS